MPEKLADLQLGDAVSHLLHALGGGGVGAITPEHVNVITRGQSEKLFWHSTTRDGVSTLPMFTVPWTHPVGVVDEAPSSTL